MPAMIDAVATPPEMRAFMSVAFPDESDDEQQQRQERDQEASRGEVLLQENDPVEHQDGIAEREPREAERAPRKQRRARLAPGAEEQPGGHEAGQGAKRIN